VGPNEERVTVAVGSQVDRVQRVAARLALPPERVARSAVEVDLARPLGRLDGIAIHPREHEDRARPGILHDRRHEAALVEVHLGNVQANARSGGRMGMPAAASTFFTSRPSARRSGRSTPQARLRARRPKELDEVRRG